MARKLARVILGLLVTLGLAPPAQAADSGEKTDEIAVWGNSQNPLRNESQVLLAGTSGSASKGAVITAAASTPELSAGTAGKGNTILGVESTNSASAGPESALGVTNTVANPVANPEQSGEAIAEGDCFEPEWRAEAGALFFWRTSTRGPQLLSDPVSGTLLRSSNLSFDCDGGPRISLIRTLCDWELELNYLGVDGSQANAAFPNSALPTGIGVLTVDKTIPLPITAATFADTSRLFSSEINLRRPVRPWLTVMAGFRWVELDDTYGAQGTEAVLSSPFSETIRAHNNLFGLQSGLDAALLKDTCFQIHGFFKSGLFYDVVSQNTTLSNPANLGTLAASADGGHAAFVGEIGLFASQQIYKNTVVRGGYEAMFLDGVALAPRQIPSTNLTTGAASTETGGGLVYHGISVTLEVSW
jgi:hypothetical protein